jgi:hypothetical protein
MRLRNSIRAGLASILVAGALYAGDYSTFTRKDEISDIIKHSKRIGIEPEMLMALRMTENGSDRVAYGILPQGKAKQSYECDKGYKIDGRFFQYSGEVEKQMCWAGWTIKRRQSEFNSMQSSQKSKYLDFIDYLGDRYAPIGVKNDPNNHNKNWEKNFRAFYDKFSSSK